MSVDYLQVWVMFESCWNNSAIVRNYNGWMVTRRNDYGKSLSINIEFNYFTLCMDLNILLV